MGAVPPQYGKLLADMALALRSEFGARSFYRLARRIWLDRELRAVLERLEVEQATQVEGLRSLMAELGGQARRGSWRRWVGSLLTCAAALFLGRSFALRVCIDANWTVARWYGQYRGFFLQLDEAERAARCAAFATTKQRHARVLETWLDPSRPG